MRIAFAVKKYFSQLTYSIVFLLTAQYLFSQPIYTANVYSKNPKGYYFLYTYKVSKEPHVPAKEYQMILDAKGRIVYFKNFPGSSDFRLQSNGLAYYYISNKSGANFYIIDSAFKTIDTIACRNGIFTDGHDFQILPDGHYLLLGYETVTMDLSKYKMFLKRNIPGSSHAQVKCNVIQELDKNKNVVFEWHAKDYFQFDDIDNFFIDDSQNVDWTHFNSVDMDKDGNLLVSSKHFNQVIKINHHDSSIIWRMGGKRNQFRFINDSIPFLAPHDVRRIKNGNITLLDNGYGDSSHIHPARALEYNIDERNKTTFLKWSYVRKPEIFSSGTGNVQRLKNGNTLVNFGRVLNDSNNILFEVIKSSGEKVFDIRFADTLVTYRGFYYPSLPWKLDRPEIKYYRSGKDHYLDAGSGHSSYRWPNGDTTQTIKITTAGNYYVYVPKGEGGFISSQIFTVSDKLYKRKVIPK